MLAKNNDINSMIDRIVKMKVYLSTLSLLLLVSLISTTYTIYKTNTTIEGTIEDMPEIDGSIFQPGHSTIDRRDIYNRCFVDPIKYQTHFNNPTCTVSEKYKIIFPLIPKSGSSTARHIIKHSFDGQDVANCRSLMKSDNYTIISAPRNPLTRFYASYDEALVRQLTKPQRIPQRYRKFRNIINATTYDEYQELFGQPQLTKAFEQFVHDYDGKRPFDIHLKLQSPFLTDPGTGARIHTGILMDLNNMDNEFAQLARKMHVEIPKPFRARSYPRRFNVSMINDETVQKICELSALDFCCTNTQLPPACTHNKVGHRVGCKNTKNGIISVIY